MANKSNSGKDQKGTEKKANMQELEVVETELTQEFGFVLATSVFVPNDIYLNLDFASSNNSETSTSNNTSGGKEPKNIEFVSEGVSVHDLKNDPFMTIPEGELDANKKATIKAKAEKSKREHEERE